MCGKVQCTNVDVNHPPPGAHVSIQIINGSSCVNADFNLGPDVLDPAYVNPGSPCAEGKVRTATETFSHRPAAPLKNGWHLWLIFSELHKELWRRCVIVLFCLLKTCLDFKCVNASTIRPNLDCDNARTCNGRGVSAALSAHPPRPRYG